MPLTDAPLADLLQSLGWAIANSLWQTAVLWLVYKIIVSLDKTAGAVIKYYLSISLLVISFVCFLYTTVQNYRLLSAGDTVSLNVNAGWRLSVQPLNSILPYLSAIYLVVLCFYTGRFFIHLSRTHFLQNSGLSRAPVDFRLFTNQTALHLGIKKKVSIWLSENVDVPSVSGFIKPVILLPLSIISNLSPRQTEAVLLHELAHIKRNDYLINLLQSVLELILFFNPFAVMLSKTARKERENCCDDWVLNFRYDHYEYAKALLILEEQRYWQKIRFALAATGGKKKLLVRVKRLFNAEPQTVVKPLQKLIFAALCVLLFTAGATFVPYLTKESIIDEPTVVEKIQNSNLSIAGKVSKENIPAVSLISSPAISISRKVQRTNRKTGAKKPLPDREEVFVNAFINKEFIDPLSEEALVVSPAVEVEIHNNTIFVKIEEQQSGKKQTNTYYFELKNIDGNITIKPLVIFNKFSSIPKKVINKSFRDSSIIPTPQVKKRVTS